MTRSLVSEQNILARIRSWFGLRQEQLALYLDVSPALVRSIETRRRSLTLPVGEAMLPLARQLPEPITLLDEPLPTTLPPGCPAPDASALDFRRRVCLQRAARLRAQVAPLARRAHHARRWQQALPTLLAAHAISPGTADPDEVERAAWLTGWLHRRARPLTGEEVTRWHLLEAQAQAYEFEAATLAAL
ncbi:helix-turn-helix transcriptional regulator [Hymenobacter sp. BT175]|uniref:helix-turn-helix domain-containing protein n=1 Tax=Hymenobacter translucens TaxID=2886507 RepID=UPI001D0E3DF9|nr:helix-turn-helix transcriptional regulator [Hymenobacter translucens]MCC2544962.1 helix-turn-helix transcriptional regulator [Hymenobacter translucens]